MPASGEDDGAGRDKQQKIGDAPQVVSFRRAYLTLSPGESSHLFRESRRATLSKAGSRAAAALPSERILKGVRT
jgi:hypothetical protein